MTTADQMARRFLRTGPGAVVPVVEVAPSCACAERRDYDGERIRTHCVAHCPRVAAGDWDQCMGC